MAEEHPVHIPFKVKDEASRAIDKISEHTEHLGHSVDHTLSRLTEMGSAIAGIGGLLGFERMVDAGKESLEQIKKMSALTGTPAADVAALRDSFEQSGLSAEQLGMTVTALGKKTLLLEEGSKGLTMEAKRWGVELKKGPVAALLSMSEAVKKHKIGMAEVAKLTRTSGEATGAMMDMLERGPEELKEMIDHAKKLNVHLEDPGALERFEKFHEASTKIHEAWRRISERVVVTLAPAMSKMADKISSWIGKIDVDKFVGTLVKGMELAVNHAKQLGQILLANMVLERTLGRGILGTAMGASGAVGKIFGGGHGEKGESKEGGHGKSVTQIIPAHGAVFRVVSAHRGGDEKKEEEEKTNKASGVLDIIKGFMGLASKVTVFLAIVGAIAQFAQHSAKIRAQLGAIFDKLGAIGTKLWDALGPTIEKLGGMLLDMLSTILDGVTRVIETIQTMFDGLTGDERATKRLNESMKGLGQMTKFGTGELGMTVTDLVKAMNANTAVNEKQRAFFAMYEKTHDKLGIEENEQYRALKARYGAVAPERATAPAAGVYQDFRNSRFEIEQKFAEGFDPDRIAVGFANDVASLGERQLNSRAVPALINGIR